MILPVQQRLRAHLQALLRSVYAIDEATLPALVLEYPPNRELGDLGTPVAFELARRLRKAPKAIAQEIAQAFGTLEGIRQVAAAPNGYLNFFLDRPSFLLDRLAAPPPVTTAPGKAIVEHTAINPNKAAHVGHLRNAALGDTLVRVLRFQGVPVEVQNYIDDTGVQVADVVVGFRELEGMSLDQVEAVAESTQFDYHCWDLYARVTEWYGDPGSPGHAERLKIRADMLHDIEHGGNDNATLAAFIADRIVRCHLKTMARMNVDYDLLTWEGDILRLKFWAQAFDVLKAKGAVQLRTEGRLAGCWVMPIQEDLSGGQGAGGEGTGGEGTEGEGASSEEADPEEREKVIVRSNGVVTYVGKDIAYQFWKLGLLGRDFHYRVFGERATGGSLWATTTTGGTSSHPLFGGAAYVYNVIDVRQSYLQKLLKQALIAVGHPEGADRSHHFSYEMVALSHATARTLGHAPPPESEDAKRPFVEVSGRKGLGVKADDLLDTLIATARGEVARRNAELADADVERTARLIAIAAVRYFLVKFSRGKVIAFDLDEALSFEGESGPYVQYAVVRANNIFQKVATRDGLDEAGLLASLKDVPPAELTGDNGSHDLWALVLDASRLDEIVEQVVRSLEFSVLAKYAFSLAQAFNAFYHRSQILNEERDDVRRWRAAAVIYLRNQLTKALDLMGIDVPARM
jgi:arginyl-tRNA synthetase